MTSKTEGLDVVLRNLNKEIGGVRTRSASGLKKAALFVLAEAKKLTPVVTGNLRGSGYTESGGTPERPTEAIGFSAVYALSVHENPRSGKTGGVSPSGREYTAGTLPSGRKSTRKIWSTVGQWKFLETPLKERAKTILDIIRGEVGG